MVFLCIFFHWVLARSVILLSRFALPPTLIALSVSTLPAYIHRLFDSSAHPRIPFVPFFHPLDYFLHVIVIAHWT